METSLYFHAALHIHPVSHNLRLNAKDLRARLVSHGEKEAGNDDGAHDVLPNCIRREWYQKEMQAAYLDDGIEPRDAIQVECRCLQRRCQNHKEQIKVALRAHS